MIDFFTVLPVVIVLIFTGIFAGVLAGLLGVGGGIVIVPVLYFIFQGFGVSSESSMAIAVATSLAVIVPTSISSIRSHFKAGNIDTMIMRQWTPFIFLFALLGSLFSKQIDAKLIISLFGIIACFVSVNMIFKNSFTFTFRQLPSRFIQTMMASVVGFLSVMIGIGGGTLGVPILSSLNLATHRAVGTAACFGLFIALPGALMALFLSDTPNDALIGHVGLVSLPALFLIAPLTVIFAPIGVKLGKILNQNQLKKVFAVTLFFTGLRMLYKAY